MGRSRRFLYTCPSSAGLKAKSLNGTLSRIASFVRKAFVSYRTTVAYAIVLASVSCAPAPSANGLTPDDLSAIRDTSQRYVEAMRRNDWSAVAEFFTTDAIRMPPNQPLQRGRAEIERSFSQVDIVSEYEVILEDIQGISGLAYAYATYTITLTLKGADGPITDSGKAIEVWRKESDGRWRIAAAIWNSDLPVAGDGL